MISNLRKVFEEIGATSSRNDKIHILKANSDYSEFKILLNFLKNPYITTGISSKRIKKKVNCNINNTHSNIVSLLDYISTNNTGSDAEIAVIQAFLSSLDKEDRLFVEKVVTKSLKIGVDVKTINKAFGYSFIPEFNCMLAEKYQDNIDFVNGKSFTLTTKQDGIRVLAIKKGNNVQLFSRQGQLIKGLIDIEKELQNMKEDFVLDGELMIENSFEMISGDRYKAVSKIVRKDGEKYGIKILVFDILTIKEFEEQHCVSKYLNRRKSMENMFKNCYFISVLPVLYSGNDIGEIDYWLRYEVSRGEEGIMINLNDCPYQFKRTKYLLKYKAMQDCDIRCIGIEEGDGNFKGTLGAIVVEFNYNNTMYQTKCGSGFSLEARDKYWKNPSLIVGQIVTIKYFEISRNDKGGYGLRFPIFKDVSSKTQVSMF